MKSQEHEHSRKNNKLAESIRNKDRKHIKGNIRSEFIESAAEKQLSDKQRQFFTEKNFLTVFSEEQMKELDIDWQVFQTGQFDDSANRQTIRIIKDFMREKDQKNTSKECKELYYKILQLNQDRITIHYDRLKRIASDYFKRMFSECKIEVMHKFVGVQFGNIFKIYPQNGKSLTYYVKTHSGGLANTFYRSWPIKILNPIEPMVYKILQKLGLGCESHFFGRDLKNFYIATKDAGHDGLYLSYGQLVKSNEGYSKMIQSEDFSNGIFCIDLLSRILRQTDLLENPNNFGFVKTFDGWKIKAIDFRVTPRDNHYYTFESCFRGFLGGFTSVPDGDKVILNLFKEEKENLGKIAKRIFVNKFKDFNDIVDESERDVVSTIDSNVHKEISEKDYADMLEKLSSYKKAIRHNFALFCGLLKITQLVKCIEIQESDKYY